jgi:Leucine-rich repeat (LRR) protein
LILSNTSLTELTFGVFAHQLNLKLLDIADNNFSDIDFHIFSSNSNLEILDISGTNISQVRDCKKIGEILPKLKLLGVADNNWKCTALSKLKVCLNTQLIKLMLPDHPTKNQSNVMGVKCIYDQNDTISTTTTASIKSTISVDNYISEIMDKIHELDGKIVATKPLEPKGGITMLELILSILLSICGTLLGLFAFNKAKNYLKINRFRMPRMSRRDSPDTTVTYDSNMVH